MDLLVVPKSRTQALMHLAHAHPFRGHLGARNTLEKLKDNFVWSGMDAEVWRNNASSANTRPQGSPRRCHSYRFPS